MSEKSKKSSPLKDIAAEEALTEDVLTTSPAALPAKAREALARIKAITTDN
jgi:hypothetical protein